MDRSLQLDWLIPAAFPALAAGQIHVWSAWLDDPRTGAPAAGGPLSAEELARAGAFHFAADRRRYVASHVMLRGLLARYLASDPATLAFATGPSGKPALTGDRDLQFNLSHSGPLGLLAVTRGQPVGVDVELRWEMPDLTLLEERMFTPAARRRQQRLAPEPRLRGFYRRWTQLEAAGKCRGTGLDLDHISPDTEHLVPADPAEGFTGCVACQQPPARIDFFQFGPEVLTAPSTTTAPTHPILPGLPHRQPGLARLSST